MNQTRRSRETRRESRRTGSQASGTKSGSRIGKSRKGCVKNTVKRSLVRGVWEKSILVEYKGSRLLDDNVRDVRKLSVLNAPSSRGPLTREITETISTALPMHNPCCLQSAVTPGQSDHTLLCSPITSFQQDAAMNNSLADPAEGASEYTSESDDRKRQWDQTDDYCQTDGSPPLAKSIP